MICLDYVRCCVYIFQFIPKCALLYCFILIQINKVVRDCDPLCPHIYAYDVELRYTSCIVLLQEGTLEDCLNKTFKQFKSKDQRYSQSFFALYVWLVLLYTGVSGKMRCGDEEGNREDELHDVVYLCFLILFIMQETLLNITRHTPTYSSVANLFCTLSFQFLVRKKVQESAHNNKEGI